MFTASMCSADTTNTDQHLVEYRRAWQSVTDYHLGLLSQYYTHIMCVWAYVLPEGHLRFLLR